jgi:hypothetical protein
MTFEIEYYGGRVLAEIESWPTDVLADYARLVELLSEHGQIFVYRIRVRLAMASSNCVHAVARA